MSETYTYTNTPTPNWDECTEECRCQDCVEIPSSVRCSCNGGSDEYPCPNCCGGDGGDEIAVGTDESSVPLCQRCAQYACGMSYYD